LSDADFGKMVGFGKGGGREPEAATHGVDVEVACVENDGPVDVEVVEVLEGDVLDVSVSDVRTGPGLESCTVLGIQHDDVLNVGVLNDVLDARVLADTAHGDAMAAVAIDSGDQDVGGVGFGAEAVVADVNPRVSDCEAVDVVAVPAVGVFGKDLEGAS